MNNPLIIPCPSCHADITVPRALLTEMAAECRCKQCGQMVVLNEHLLISDDNPLFDDEPLITAESHFDVDTLQSEDDLKLDIPKPSSKSEASEILIHDDMEIEEAIDPIIEYDSLEEMSAWISQLEIEQAPSINAILDKQNTDNQNTNNQNLNHQNIDTEVIFDIDLNEPHSISETTLNPTLQKQPSIKNPSSTSSQAKPSHSSTVPMSSVNANNINVSIAANNSSHNNENTWLETLLQEQNDGNPSVASDTEDTELAKLLTDSGMPTANEKENTGLRATKISDRMQSSSPEPPLPVSSIVWSVGSILLLLLLVLQFVGFNLESLAKKPAIAPRLQTVCTILPCQVPSADIRAFAINKPSAKPSRVKSTASFTDIQAQLINQSNQSQLLPHLKVSLHNKEGVMGEFIASPQQYLLSSENKLAAERGKSVMFTVPIPASQITSVEIEPIY